MYPPELMQSRGQMMVKQLLGGTTSAALGQISKNCGIEDIAARLQKQQNGASENMNTVLTDEPSDPSSIYNNTPLMTLICDDCGLEKNSSEDMEVHIKTEHLRWLPFQCPICLCERASDAQMREHVHVMHRKVMHKFIYADNVAAKRELQTLMDRSLSNAISRRKSDSSTKDKKNNTISNNSLNQLNNLKNSFAVNIRDENFKNGKFDLSESPPAEPMPGSVSEGRKRPHVEITEGSSSTDALLACISRAATAAGAIIEGEVLDDVNPLSSLFNAKKLKADIDQLMEASHNDSELDGYGDENVLEGLNPLSVLDDVAALFGQSDGRIEEAASEKRLNSSKSSQVSKKRVLGECSKCNKPVTAGARQMHMFFHLAKDHGTYRFRCKFEGCQVEHYRKDQMENHQSKVHGKIDPDMMEDRSLELFQRCQELSMELLGTKNGSTPGPTAVKAEAAYQAQQAANKARGLNSGATKSPATMSNSMLTNRGITDDEHPLECRLCGKTMQNRIRGFHILWHMAKDMGINRYICKFCNFGHDRSQSVQTHGKKEHGTEDVVQDRINEYEDEVKQMSEKCFGFQALFSQDNKRRSKIPVTIPSSKRRKDDGEGTNSEQDETNSTEFQDEEPILTLDDIDTVAETYIEAENQPEFAASQNQSSVVKAEVSSTEVKVESDPLSAKEDVVDEESSPSRTPARKRRSNGRFPRFGLRRPASKVKKLEMAKLREISLLLGGAHYYKKKTTEVASCELCGKLTSSRLGEHAYTHMDQLLFLCPKCDFGASNRDAVTRHVREVHDSNDRAVDNRLKFAEDIKGTIKKCYSNFFVDMPIPTAQDIEKLKQQMGNSSARIAGISHDNEENEDEHDPEHDDEELDEEESSLHVEENSLEE